MPWSFLPIAAAALAIEPADHGVRFLAAANLARLGLKTLAHELLEVLPDTVTHHPDIRALTAALSGLPNDALTVDMRRRWAEVNLEALAGRGHDLRSELPAAASRWSDTECFRTLDGNTVRRAASAARGDLRVLAWLADARSQARSAGASVVRTGRAWIDPVVIEGVDPPWTLLEAWNASATHASGYRARLWVLQADARESIDGLSLSDLRALVSDPRVEWHIGPACSETLLGDLRARFHAILPDLLLTQPFVRTRCEPAPADVLGTALREQGEALNRLHARVHATYSNRDGAYWANRFAEARAGGPPLRVLIPTSRHSTFVRHASADLSRALTRTGCTTEVLQEPDACSRLSSLAYLDAFDRLDPDLVVLINFTRDALGDAIPQSVPYVCWIQDAVPQLFTPEAGARQGPLDFMAGHLFPELFERFGYPRARSKSLSVVADAEKFHTAPVCAPKHAVHACELVFISHHSETPDAMHERLLRDAGDTRLHTVFERLRTDLEGVIERCATESPEREIRERVLARLRESFGEDPGDRVTSLTLRLFALPLADRILRHQTLAWAADICERRGWRLHIHGNGWEGHPRFGAFARGPLEHGEDLRAAYASASANLHISLTTLVHQRVIECALSGGVSLVRFQRDALSGTMARTEAILAQRPRDYAHEHLDLDCYWYADHPEAAAYARLSGALGVPVVGQYMVVHQDRVRAFRDGSIVPDPAHDAHWVLGDLAEFAFSTPDGLEHRLDLAVNRPAWRRSASAMQARVARRHLTHDAAAGEILSLVERGLRVQ